MRLGASILLIAMASPLPAQHSVGVPDLGCTPVRLVVRGAAILAADNCGKVVTVDRDAFVVRAVEQTVADRMGTIDEENGRYIVLTDGRTTVREISGNRETRLFTNTFNNPIGQVVYWNGAIVTSILYGPNLIDVHDRSGTLTRSLIPNPNYDPRRRKVLTSFADLVPLDRELLLFDRFDFRLFRISHSWEVTLVQRERHPAHAKFTSTAWYADLVAQPPATGASDPESLTFGGTYIGISSCSCGGTFYALMVPWGDSAGSEIAYAPIGETKWTGRIAVPGAPNLIACDERMLYVLDWKAKRVDGQQRPGR